MKQASMEQTRTSLIFVACSMKPKSPRLGEFGPLAEMTVTTKRSSDLTCREEEETKEFLWIFRTQAWTLTRPGCKMATHLFLVCVCVSFPLQWSKVMKHKNASKTLQKSEWHDFFRFLRFLFGNLFFLLVLFERMRLWRLWWRMWMMWERRPWSWEFLVRHVDTWRHGDMFLDVPCFVQKRNYFRDLRLICFDIVLLHSFLNLGFDNGPQL